MITNIEIQVLDWIYTCCCSKIMRMPLYWEHGRLTPRSKYGETLYNGVLCSILFLDMAWSLKQVSVMTAKRNINGSIIQVIYIMRYLAHIMLRFNILIFKTELIQVINQSLDINSTWGNKNKN